jgi:hypothetical protein
VDEAVRVPREAIEASVEAFVDGTARFVDAVAASFPENIFFDADALLWSAWQRAARGPAEVTRYFALLTHIHELFGKDTPIRFRYVHDFLYGFDWAKWVAKAPDARRGCAPFGIEFLEAMAERGGELLGLIASDDAKYPRLTEDGPRNPFPFSRSTAAESMLLLHLRDEALLPVRAWEVFASELGPSARWELPFQRLREERARALGLERQT